MKLPELKRAVRALPPRTLRRLETWLRELVLNAEAAKRDRGAIRRPRAGKKTYRLQGVRCGGKDCKCRRGELHGPYWYAFWREGGRTRSQYVGKRLPAGVRNKSRAPRAPRPDGGRG